jgi:serine/threonine protein kinase
MPHSHLRGRRFKLLLFNMRGDYIDVLFGQRGFKVPQKVHGSDGHVYVVEEQLGYGGNAVVCQCTDERDGMIYAVKFLTNLRDPKRLPRFHLETRLIEKLTFSRHDHLIRFIASGEAKSLSYDRKRRQYFPVTMPFFVMEKASMTLRDYLASSALSIEPEVYNAQFRGLVGALEILHEHAIHRDIKPDNILVVGDRWAISDFGLCELVDDKGEKDLTRVGEIPGPRFWLSPEANNRSVGLQDEISSASDVFQLAAVFWWVVTRRHPSGILTRDDWTGAEKLFGPISTALQHSLNRRYQSAKQFCDAVTNAIDDVA